MALLNDPFALIATTSLIIQVIVLFLLLYGYLLKRRLKFRQHGITMTAAVILHLVMIFVIMIPSFVLAVVPNYILPKPLEIVSIVGLIHGIAGVLAASLGVWRVASWRFRRDFKGCFNKKKYMLATMIIWLTALSLGIILYTIFYWPILIS
jgi:uncharacterized membrane protein YozB (DUF420 family)